MKLIAQTIRDVEAMAYSLGVTASAQETRLRPFDRELADKIKKLGDAAADVEQHVKERRGHVKA
jgi:hypothetical protein